MKTKNLLLFLLITTYLQISSNAHTAYAASTRCVKLRRAKVIGIKEDKQYLIRKGETKRFKSKKIAEKNGYQAYQVCSSQSIKQPAKIQSACRFVYGILADHQYLPANQIKAFRNTKSATKKGYSSYQTCPGGVATPTPTPDPNATPTPTPAPGPTFQLEDGVRFADAYSSSIVRMHNGSFLAYLGLHYSAFMKNTIKTATSNDGLTWSATQAITNIAPDTNEAFTNPSLLITSGDQYMLIYELVNHISSAGIDFYILMRALSNDGLAFTNTPNSNMLNSGTNLRRPDIIKVDDNTYRVYFDGMSGIESAVSTDGGANWTREDAITINGISDDYVYYPGGPDIIKLQDETYRLFIHSAPSFEDSLDSKLYSATSSDGRTFQIEAGPLLEPESDHRHLNPDVLRLADGRYRVYFTDMYDDNGLTFRILSAISN